MSPFELLFGRKPRLPIDLAFEKAREEPVPESTSEYIEDLQIRMAKAHEIVSKCSDKAKLKTKTLYDKRAKSVRLNVGDKVLVKQLVFQGKHKIADKFEPEPYFVIEQPRPDIPVFKVRSKSSDRERTLHRNHLLLVEHQDEPDCDASESPVSQDVDTEEINRDASKEQSLSDKLEVDCISCSDSETDDYAIDAYVNGDAHLVDLQNPDSGDDTEANGVETLTEGLNNVNPSSNGYLFQDSNSEVNTLEDRTVSGTNDQDTEPKRDEQNAEVTTIEPDPAPEVVILEQEADEPASESDVSSATESVEPAPIPAPRRSTREKKPPDRYGDFVMYQMSARQPDSKIRALDSLVRSGVLNDIDSVTARKIINSVME